MLAVQLQDEESGAALAPAGAGPGVGAASAARRMAEGAAALYLEIPLSEIFGAKQRAPPKEEELGEENVCPRVSFFSSSDSSRGLKRLDWENI